MLSWHIDTRNEEKNVLPPRRCAPMDSTFLIRNQIPIDILKSCDKYSPSLLSLMMAMLDCEAEFEGQDEEEGRWSACPEISMVWPWGTNCWPWGTSTPHWWSKPSPLMRCESWPHYGYWRTIALTVATIESINLSLQPQPLQEHLVCTSSILPSLTRSSLVH